MSINSNSFRDLSKGKLRGKMKASAPKIRTSQKKGKLIPTPPMPRLSNNPAYII